MVNSEMFPFVLHTLIAFFMGCLVVISVITFEHNSLIKTKKVTVIDKCAINKFSGSIDYLITFKIDDQKEKTMKISKCTFDKIEKGKNCYIYYSFLRCIGWSSCENSEIGVNTNVG